MLKEWMPSWDPATSIALKLTATQAVLAPWARAGDTLIIDRAASPKPGDYVVIGDDKRAHFESFDEQAQGRVWGVVKCLWRSFK